MRAPLPLSLDVRRGPYRGDPGAASRIAAVPLALQGLWRRTQLRIPAAPASPDAPALLDDRATLVYWLQTAHWHADIRIPAQRPSFAGVRSLGDCDDAQLRWLLTQQGFAGVTTVDSTPQGDLCRWHRVIDHAESLDADEGRLVFDATGLDEWGTQADYYERWQPVIRSAGRDQQALGVVGVSSGRTQAVFVRCGDWGLLVRARQLDAVATRAVRTAAAAGEPVDRARLIAAADCEITLATCGTRRWVVLRSTFPWREGHTLVLPGGLTALPTPLSSSQPHGA